MNFRKNELEKDILESVDNLITCLRRYSVFLKDKKEILSRKKTYHLQGMESKIDYINSTMNDLGEYKRKFEDKFLEPVITLKKNNTKTIVSKKNIKLYLVDGHQPKKKYIRGQFLCDECSQLKSSLYHFTKSSHGMVYICKECIDSVWDRSFPKYESESEKLPHHLIHGGLPFTNRRKF